MGRFLVQRNGQSMSNDSRSEIVVHWFRRDLRWHDNRALLRALSSGKPVLPIFIFDTNILDRLESKVDARLTFLHDQLERMKETAREVGSDILVMHGRPEEAFKNLLNRFQVLAVHANEDYEPYADQRDQAIHSLLDAKNIPFETTTDHVLMAPHEVTKPDGNPYTVFTPFSKRWQTNITPSHLQGAPSEAHLHRLYQWTESNMPSLNELGFQRSEVRAPEALMDEEILTQYGERRDIPSVRGTSRVSVHLRFGTVSIREAAKAGFDHSPKWLTELIWRDFYQAIMKAFPHSMTQAFKPQYDRVPWRHDEEQFQAWRLGQTGYPLVDAGMRELLATGFMHNRVRMVVASFLCKHLLIDWRWGERHFAAHLLDFELASNVGGWQWAAGSGCDAAPYFRVFNPNAQLQKFDPEFKYVKTWVQEWGTDAYPDPIVDHKWARQRAIDTYKAALT